MIIIIILSVCLIISMFININLLRKTESTQDELMDISLTMEDLITDLTTVYEEILLIDSKGIFESDDEVGSTFSDIKDIIGKLNDKYDLENN
tara:strand:+ start:214 stop:489 length:276 start_codon:yes stop_codon:yes gene_type:complete